MDLSNFPTYARTSLSFFGKTNLVQKVFPLIWSFKHMNYHVKDVLRGAGLVDGPEFKFHPLSEELWKLELDLDILFWNDERGVTLNLIKVSKGNSTAKEFTVSWSVERVQESKLYKKYVRVPANVRKQVLFDIQSTDFVSFTFRRNQLTNMIIQIEVDDYVERRTETPDYRSLLDKDKLAVLADMESVLKDAKFTDIALRSEGQEIRAHRAILAARSAVFKSMFQHQMSEKASGSVDIPDIPHDTLQLLVTYMYSGRLEDLDVKSASELFVASDKYAVEDLHDTCSLFLKLNLTAENCLEILMLADRHSNEDLKSFVVSYFSKHSKEIRKLRDWKNVVASQPNILELLKVAAKKS